VLRALSARLIELGARRALPGEFTARAYLNGKLDAWQVAGVLSLIGAENAASARQAARLSRGRGGQLLNELNDRLTELLARIEAGIDFVEQEDVRFITPAEVCRSIEAMRETVSGLTAADRCDSWGGKPHVALVGLPNAGKSTLFNALLGYERAIVSPILGTTRDVLSAEIELEGLVAVLQDCAGLGQAADELELATHLAAERAADQADLVLWVHDVTTAWDACETAACGRIPAGRRMLVRSKCDLEAVIPLAGSPVDFDATVDVSAATRAGLADLKRVLTDRLEAVAGGHGGPAPFEELGAVQAGLERAREAASVGGSDLASPEIVALELRSVRLHLGSASRGPVSEEVLDQIFAHFCIGK
jgi:tRNA modification GTPase